MDREAFRKAGYAAIDRQVVSRIVYRSMTRANLSQLRVCDYFEGLEKEHVMPPIAPGAVGKLVPPEAPVKGEEWKEIADDFDRVIMPGITHWQHPSFFAFFPANTTYESILADVYAGAVSNPGFNWACSPACTELEVVMMDWVASMLGLDKSFHNASEVGGGIIMGSASEACLTVCIAARARCQRLQPDVPAEKLVIYGTTQTHSLGAKAALILGLEFRAISTTAENNWALRGEELEKALKEDTAGGKVPFILLATLGSTSTGAIDNIAEITAVAADYPNLFIHVDAAWAGVFLALPELRGECGLDAINARSSAINSAAGICASGEVHSFCTNLHKSGLVMFDASCLWIRDRKLLTEALDITPPFLRNKQSDQGLVVDYRNWQIPLGRRFRSLKLYFVLRSYGVAGFQAHLRRLNGLATHLSSLVDSEPSLVKHFVPRRFALVVFRLVKEGASDTVLDELNRTFFAKTAERSDLMLTPTVVGGTYCTRVAIGSPNTREEHIDKLWSVIKELIHETLEGK